LDAVDSYCRFSKLIEDEIGLRGMDIPLQGLARCQTFRGGETKLQTAVEEALCQKATAWLVELAGTRLGGFWSGQDPLTKTRWEVILAAGRVLLEAARINNALKGKQWSAESLVARYAYAEADAELWCALDTAQHHLERDFHRFELDPQQHKMLLQLVAQARQRYATMSGGLASRFVHAYAEAKFELPSLTLRTDIFRTAVATAGAGSAHLLVDALRYEMAQELITGLDVEWAAELAPALATPPTITEIGMAALLPGAERSVTITASGSRKLTPVIDGKALRTRQDRVTYFEQTMAGKSVTVKLEQLAPLTSNHPPSLLGNLHAATAKNRSCTSLGTVL